jgi:hypothetical protein
MNQIRYYTVLLAALSELAIEGDLVQDEQKRCLNFDEQSLS